MVSSKGTLSHVKSLKVLYHVGSNLPREPGGDDLARKVIIVSLSLVFILLTGGVIFGFSAIEDILTTHEGAFASSCAEGESIPCEGQLLWTAFIVTLATASVSLSALPVGAFLDVFGPRITACVASVVFASGLLAIGFAKALSEWLYVYGFVALAVSGPAITTSMNNFSDLFGEKGPGILSIQSGAFQVSSVMMVAASQAISKFGFSLTNVCCYYVAVPVSIFVASLLLFPDKAYGSGDGPGQRGEPHRAWLIRRILVAQNRKDEEVSSSVPLSSKDHPLIISEDESPLLVPMLSPEDSVPQPPELYNTDICQQVCSVPFLVIASFIAFFMLVINFSIATVHDQLLHEAATQKGSQSSATFELAAQYISFFSLMLSVGGALGIPLLGFLLVKYGLPTAFLCQGFIDLVFLLFQVPGVIPLRMKVIGYLAFGLNRPVAFGSFTTYLAEIFGFRNFGKLYGLAQLTILIVGPVQFLLPGLVKGYFKGSYFWVNVAIATAQFNLMIFYPLYITRFLFSGFFFRPNMPSRRSRVQASEP